MARSLIAWPPTALFLLLGALPIQAEELAGVEDASRARNNYMLNCQGCHGPNGEGNELAHVPKMQGFVGNFLKVEGGREFVVQVPGSAYAALPDDALAELLNWMLPTMSRGQMPAEFRPYRTKEVSALRQSPETDVIGRRASLIQAMQNQGVATN